MSDPTFNDPVPSFLGRGWSFPPIFDRTKGSVAMSSGDTDIRQSLWILLSTSLGERTMLATYGCSLAAKVFTSLTTSTANEICSIVRYAITQWEPRVRVESVSVTERDEAYGWLSIDVTYTIRETNTRSNLVYPFYILEATIPTPPQ